MERCGRPLGIVLVLDALNLESVKTDLLPFFAAFTALVSKNSLHNYSKNRQNFCEGMYNMYTYLPTINRYYRYLTTKLKSEISQSKSSCIDPRLISPLVR